MQCIVLCAGFATRLYPLTRHRPKQLLSIGSGCVLDQIMDRISDAGIKQATLVCNQRFIHEFEQWRRQQPSPVSVHLIDNGVTAEDQRRGSVGDLNLALETIDLRDDFWVLHGDNFFTFSLCPVMNAFHQQGNTLVLYDVVSEARARRAGQVTCNASDRIIDFVEKPLQPKSTWVSIGIYAFRAEIRSQIQQYMATGRSTDRSGDLMAWLHTRVPLYAFRVPRAHGVWIDIGTPTAYQRAKTAIQNKVRS
ncbi:MAG: nucleotidyltransferase family protein [Desulfobacteraceae bacterium]|jgi:glucose-1-phosphate thymidylyltransferase